MKEKNILKIIIILIIIVVITFICVIFYRNVYKKYIWVSDEYAQVEKIDSDNIERKIYNGKIYNVMKVETEYEYDYISMEEGEIYSKYNKNIKNREELRYYREYLRSYKDEFPIMEILEYNEYKDFCKKWDLNQKYSDDSKRYIIISEALDVVIPSISKVADMFFSKDSVTIYTNGMSTIGMKFIGPYKFNALIIPVNDNIKNFNIIKVYTQEQFNEIKK